MNDEDKPEIQPGDLPEDRSVRRRWVYETGLDGEPIAVEVDLDWKPTSRTSAVDRYIEDSRLYGGARATDGVAIDSRTKHKAYMKRHGLTTADDFDKPGGVWERAHKQRETMRGAADGEKRRFPESERREIREALGRAWYKARRD